MRPNPTRQTFLHKPLALALVSLSGLALAATTSYSLIVAGQVATDKAIVVSGKTYVPLSALKLLGVTSSLKGSTLTLAPGSAGSATSPGGANGRASLEGCLGETLFNGIWRLTVKRLDPITRDPGTGASRPGWGLTVELRNGARATLAPTDTGVSGTGQGVNLILPDGSALEADSLDIQKLTFAVMPQGGVAGHQIKYYFPLGTRPEAAVRPIKFLLEIDKSYPAIMQRRGTPYTSPTPSFRVRLDCQK